MRFPSDSWKAKLKVEMGDMNTMLIKTKNGRSILIQHDVSTPRPYSRINTITGTKGIFADYPFRLALEDKPGAGAHRFFPDEKADAIRQEFMHPLWKQYGEMARKIGDHDGMDFLMVLRLAYCLQNGLPLDQNVYDLASWSCLCELTEKSVLKKQVPLDEEITEQKIEIDGKTASVLVARYNGKILRVIPNDALSRSMKLSRDELIALLK